jgi:SAM-dependent methyltransferase
MRYYSEKLSAARLKRVYDIASPRVKRYLSEEVNYARSKMNSDDLVLDLGCGYGRTIKDFAAVSLITVGIDTSYESLYLASNIDAENRNVLLICMDALFLGFRDFLFDVVVCIQNGISAFHVDQRELIRESIRVTKQGGLILFSTYSDKFWDERLRWFEIQAEEGLLGEIDYDKTGDGTIVCKDGFKATTLTEEELLSLTESLDVERRVMEIDESSLFLEIVPKG